MNCEHEVRGGNATDSRVNMTSSSMQANGDSQSNRVLASEELMKTSDKLHRVHAATAAFLGVLFFFIIVGVFGLPLAIAGLAVFVLGAIVVFRVFPTEGAK